jgi:hypothetical protein
MRLIALALVLAATAAGCASSAGRAAPASLGVRGLVHALRADDPRAAYALLSGDVRRDLSFDEFALQWKQTAAERAWQARALEESLRGDPDVGERARVAYGDGKTVELEREGDRWRLESALVARVRASRPRDAIRQLAEALRARDLDGALRVLTARRRDGLARQIEGFVTGISRRIDDRIEEIGTDRAELRWDENGVRYRIVLRREEDEWRIDDVHVRVLPEDEAEGEAGSDDEPTLPDR